MPTEQVVETIAPVNHTLTDFEHTRDLGFTGDGEEMENCVGRTTERCDRSDRVVERFNREDLRRSQVRVRHFDSTSA